MFSYSNNEAALFDVLRLSRAMSYKCAIAGVKAGGGKAVIIGDPKKIKNEALLRSYAEEIKNIQGRFYTGEDVGITESDVQYMLKISPFFIGKSSLAGDPSPYASMSVYFSMQAAANFVWGNNSLKNKKIAIKGVGKVGGGLLDYLVKENADIIISDIDDTRLKEIQSKFPKINICNPQEIHKSQVDIYSPCAMGSEFTEKNMNEIKAKIICGGANNQLLNEDVGDWFFSHNIIYIPDYVSNGGGLINVVDELEQGGYSKNRVIQRIKRTSELVDRILNISKKEGKSPNRIANMMAENIFKNKVNQFV
jgi:leucine dehydrogenase